MHSVTALENNVTSFCKMKQLNYVVYIMPI